jgi:uncharacterized membrane protein YqjE
MALYNTVFSISSSLVGLLRTRLELFALEAVGEKARIIKLFGMAFAALHLLTLALLIFTVMVAVFFWPSENRYLALAVLAAVYGLMGVMLLAAVRRMLTGAYTPFAVTLEELGRDVELLNKIRQAPAGDKSAARRSAEG